MKKLLLIFVITIISMNIIAVKKDRPEMKISPNPFEEKTFITVTAPDNLKTILKIVDKNENTVAILHKGLIEDGERTFVWDGSDIDMNPLPAGKYECILDLHNRFTSVKKIIILK